MGTRNLNWVLARALAVDLSTAMRETIIERRAVAEQKTALNTIGRWLLGEPAQSRHTERRCGGMSRGYLLSMLSICSSICLENAQDVLNIC